MKQLKFLMSNFSLLIGSLLLPLGMYYFASAQNMTIATGLLIAEAVIMAILVLRK